MKKRIFLCFIFFLLLIFLSLIVCILRNSDVYIENLNFRTFNTEIENNEMIVFKERHMLHNKIYGRNYTGPAGIYIYYNPEISEFVIWTHHKIFTTSNEKLFWKKLNEGILAKIPEQKIYIINFCIVHNANNEFFEKLRKQNNFEEMEVDYCTTEGHENEIGYYNYTKYDSFVTFEILKWCTCGSDSWIDFTDENKFINKCKVLIDWFYY